MEILELMKQRHSVRQYKDIAIGPEQRIALNHLIEEINGIFRFFMTSRNVLTP